MEPADPWSAPVDLDLEGEQAGAGVPRRELRCRNATAAQVGETLRVESLADLRKRRVHDCRLTPDRALGTLDEAEQFLLERGVLTLTQDCALPSLFAACHEEPYKRGSAGFGCRPKTESRWG